MKTTVALSAVVLYALFAVVLLFQLASEKRNPSWQRLLDEGAFKRHLDSDKYVLRQSSNKAIINVDSTAFAEEIYSGKVKIVCAQPGSSTLIRIMAGEPGILDGKLKGPGPVPYVESNGKVVVVNGAGIIVRATAIFDWDEEQGLVPIKSVTGERALAVSEGNEYAMAIQESRAIRVSRPMMNNKPDGVGTKASPVIKDTEK